MLYEDLSDPEPVPTVAGIEAPVGMVPIERYRCGMKDKW
jgi:hypothetical protein